MENKNVKKAIDDFMLDNEENQNEAQNEKVIIKQDKSIVERINKKVITEDGRQLLT
jgi:hypothetical protein